ncbi:MAG: hypothetical protein H7343_18130 [Undibacterium sp.]|nr:hypothetical protein [Opitutaceae bacterium]
MKKTLVLIACALAAGGVSAARAEQLLDVNLAAEIRLGRRPPPPPPAVVIVVEEPAARGRAPWERARWYQRDRGYYYYPGGDVYYRPGDHVWFYQERGEWRSARNLPEFVRVDFNRSITLTMATDRPYIYHQQVVMRYPSNYFVVRVRLRDEAPRGRDGDESPRSRDDDHRGPDRDKDDHDRGRGKAKGRDDRK